MFQSPERTYSEEVNKTLARFANERLSCTSVQFHSRFVSYLHLSHSGEELHRFLETASRLARLQVALHLLFRSPLFHLELPLLLLAGTVTILGFYFAIGRNQPALGFLLISGALVHAVAIANKLRTEYRQSDLRVRIYRELREIIDAELQETCGDNKRNASLPEIGFSLQR